MNRLMTRGEWEFHARMERMERAEMERVKALRGKDLLVYLAARLKKHDPVAAGLLDAWAERTGKHTAFAFELRAGERHGMPAAELYAETTLADGTALYACERVTPEEVYHRRPTIDDAWQKTMVPYLASNLAGVFRDKAMEALLTLSADAELPTVKK